VGQQVVAASEMAMKFIKVRLQQLAACKEFFALDNAVVNLLVFSQSNSDRLGGHNRRRCHHLLWIRTNHLLLWIRTNYLLLLTSKCHLLLWI